ncbi:hypothetical protein B0H13DRAFT_1872896 [Mycena leptocephala]|nr:hypothetical protein B0H13DRAFT_1872896 [Mycena leptocephala]
MDPESNAWPAGALEVDGYLGQKQKVNPKKRQWQSLEPPALQAANQRNGVVFCFNEDLHGPKSENFLSVNAANQKEEESNYTLTRNRAQRSQAKENFIHDVSFPTHSLLAYLSLIYASLDLAWQPANPPPSIGAYTCGATWSIPVYSMRAHPPAPSPMCEPLPYGSPGVRVYLQSNLFQALNIMYGIYNDLVEPYLTLTSHHTPPKRSYLSEGKGFGGRGRGLVIYTFTSTPGEPYTPPLRTNAQRIPCIRLLLKRMSHRYMRSAVPAGMEMWRYIGWKKKDGSQSLCRTLALNFAIREMEWKRGEGSQERACTCGVKTEGEPRRMRVIKVQAGQEVKVTRRAGIWEEEGCEFECECGGAGDPATGSGGWRKMKASRFGI